ncbi:spore germination YkwD domain-containing protein [Paenibacillus xylanivorans]|nr:CAP domain-containing protein [Paenibacillus xylanivorans]
MTFNSATTREAINAWLSTAYHREILLDDQYTSVDIGLKGGTAFMMP